MPWEKQFDVDEALDRAVQVFWDRGFAASSMQDLVDAMGINRGSIYATYGGKRELFLMALRAYHDRMRQRVLVDLEKNHSPRRAIRELFEVFAHDVAD